MKKNKIALMLTGAMLVTALMGGCGKKEETTESTTVAATESIAELTSKNVASMSDADSIDLGNKKKDGYILSDLTGEWIDEKFENVRPFAFMINNVEDSLPQYGIEDADVIYEFKVEGGITRLLAVFQDWYNIERLESIRSSRHYYVYMAYYLNCFYGHAGWSPQASDTIAALGIPFLNYGANAYMAFERDNSREAPHNVYTNTEMLKEGIEALNYGIYHDPRYVKPFAFNDEEKELKSGNKAVNVRTLISGYTHPYFEYDEKEKVYYRFQFGDKHIDANTGNQLKFKNILIMEAAYSTIDDYGRQDVDLSGGNGWYVTDGEYIPITWACENNNNIVYYTEDGKQLKMNPGKTFISVCDSTDSEDNVVFE